LNRLRLVIAAGWCAALIFALSGCIAHTGPDSSRSNLNEETVSRIFPGKSTRADVIALLGQPDEASADGKRFTYARKYEVAVLFPGGTGPGKKPQAANRYLLNVEFDEQGIVSRLDFSAPYEFHDKQIRGAPPFNSPPLYR